MLFEVLSCTLCAIFVFLFIIAEVRNLKRINAMERKLDQLFEDNEMLSARISNQKGELISFRRKVDEIAEQAEENGKADVRLYEGIKNIMNYDVVAARKAVKGDER